MQFVNTQSTNLIPNIIYGSKMKIIPKEKIYVSRPKGPNNEEYIKLMTEVTSLKIEGKLPITSLVPGNMYKGVLELEIPKAFEESGKLITIEVTDDYGQIEWKRDIKIGSIVETESFIAPRRRGYITFKLNQKESHSLKGLKIKSFCIKKA